MANTVIAPGLRADIMRNQMESKNTLTSKGSLYVGLGVTQTVGGTAIYTTDALAAGSNGQFLVADSDQAKGLKWRKLTASDINDNLADRSIDGAKINLSSIPMSGSIVASQVVDGTFDTARIPVLTVGTSGAGSKLDKPWIQIGTTATGVTTWYLGSTITSIDADILDANYIKIGDTTINLGGTAPSLTGLTSVQATNFYTASDYRLKKNIKDHQFKSGILDIPVKEFEYKDSGKKSVGFIAQELQANFPELVSEREDGYLQVEENKIVFLLLEEVKKLKKKVEELENK